MGAADHSTSVMSLTDTADPEVHASARCGFTASGSCCAGLASAIEKPGDIHEALTRCLIKVFHWAAGVGVGDPWNWHFVFRIGLTGSA
jgi:hypothetical protein